jgi:DNA-binding transcriptional MocR family regulator
MIESAHINNSAELWSPTALADVDKPRYLAIVEALEADIDAGRVAFGTRLPPQREMAVRVGLSVATVGKAYAEATRRGLVAGEVGRGTFVVAGQTAPSERPSPAPTFRLLNLTHNVAPETGEAALVARAFSTVTSGPDFAALLHYAPHPGLPTIAQRLELGLVGRGSKRLSIESSSATALSTRYQSPSASPRSRERWC